MARLLTGNKQNNDCCVVAAVNVTGVPYSRLVKIAREKQGHLRRGMWHGFMIEIVKMYRRVKEMPQSPPFLSPDEWVEQHGQDGIFIIVIRFQHGTKGERSHAVAVREGKIWGSYSEGHRKGRVTVAYEIF
jgi:hypothetical protein